MGVGIYEKETLASQGKYKSIPQTHCILTYPIVLYTWKDGTGHIHICNMYWIVLRILKPPELISLAVWFRLTGLYCFAPLNELEVFFEVVDTSGGCGASFVVEIVSEQFEGKRLLERHRMVNAALEEEMKQIHALSIKKAVTPDQWKQQQESNQSNPAA
ncbi:hypothetical protein JHK86_021402 [Glycine max]|nr:hypothetical protein JHK86_021402 [Glycine max]